PYAAGEDALGKKEVPVEPVDEVPRAGPVAAEGLTETLLVNTAEEDDDVANVDESDDDVVATADNGTGANPGPFEKAGTEATTLLDARLEDDDAVIAGT
ncbi:MAG: hypothetical protein M1826_003165, partial [Phylliscum demangeonii]